MTTTVLSIKKSRGPAGQLSFVAVVDYDGETSMVGFSGSTYGAPGPIVMITGDNTQVFVSDPGRFGQTFNEGWVRRFFEAE